MTRMMEYEVHFLKWTFVCEPCKSLGLLYYLSASTGSTPLSAEVRGVKFRHDEIEKRLRERLSFLSAPSYCALSHGGMLFDSNPTAKRETLVTDTKSNTGEYVHLTATVIHQIYCHQAPSNAFIPQACTQIWRFNTVLYVKHTCSMYVKHCSVYEIELCIWNTVVWKICRPWLLWSLWPCWTGQGRCSEGPAGERGRAGDESRADGGCPRGAVGAGHSRLCPANRRDVPSLQTRPTEVPLWLGRGGSAVIRVIYRAGEQSRLL